MSSGTSTASPGKTGARPALTVCSINGAGSVAEPAGTRIGLRGSGLRQADNLNGASFSTLERYPWDGSLRARSAASDRAGAVRARRDERARDSAQGFELGRRD